MLISTITTLSNNALPVITSSTTSPPAMNSHIIDYVTETCNVYHVIPSVPMTTMVCNTNIGQPPLISAAYQNSVVTLFTPHQLSITPQSLISRPQYS